MRVVCEKCGAAYGVDEARIPPKGARAQCPKCRHLQTVRRGETAAPPPPPKAAQGPTCRVCGEELSDPFDLALGTCENCRQKESRASDSLTGPRRAAPPPPTPSEAPAPSFADAGLELDLDVKDARAQRFKGPGAAEPAPESPTTPLPRTKASWEVREAAKRAAAEITSSRAVKVATPSEPSGERSKLPLVVGALVVLVAAVAGLWFWHPPFLFDRRKGPIVPPAIAARLPEWKLAHTDLSGTATGHFEAGRKLFAEDRSTSYGKAARELQTAVLLDPLDMKAVAAYVEAFALGLSARRDPDSVKEANELIAAARQSAGKLSVVHRARANLLLAIGGRGDLDEARQEAEEAEKLAQPAELPEALVASGRCYLASSAQMAMQKLDAALKQEPELRRAYYYRGLAEESAGLFQQAVRDFEERLKRDPDHRESLLALGRVYGSVGDFKAAKETYKRLLKERPGDPEARLESAVLAYQVDRELGRAQVELERLLAGPERIEERLKIRVLTHLCAVLRLKGELRPAAEKAYAALNIDKDFAPAHFQVTLIALAEKIPEKGKEHLPAFRAALDDDSLGLEYEGRLEMSAGRFKEAADLFRKAAEKGGQRVAPFVLAGAAGARAGTVDFAFSMMRKALDLDPESGRRHVRQGAFFDEPRQAYLEAATAFEAVKGPENQALARAYAGVARYHLQEPDKAQKLLEQGLRSDPSCLGCLLYLSQIALDKKDGRKALSFAKKAVQAERMSPLAHYLVGRALELSGRKEEARKEYGEALAKGPALLPAAVAEAELMAREGQAEQARTKLLQIFTTDPLDAEARSALFRLGG